MPFLLQKLNEFSEYCLNTSGTVKRRNYKKSWLTNFTRTCSLIQTYQQLGSLKSCKSCIVSVMPKSKALHPGTQKRGRFGHQGDNEQNRNSGSRSFFMGPLLLWSDSPAWVRYSILALMAALGLVTGSVLLPQGRDSISGLPPGHAQVHAQPAPSSPSAQTNPNSLSASDISDLHKNAKQNLDSGQFEEAATQYRKILDLNPSSEDSHFALAVALARQGRDDDAVQEYEEALRLMPNYAEAHNNLGNLLAKQGKLTQAIGHFQTALKITPDYASALNNMGTVLARQGQFTQARECFEKAVQAAPDYAAAHYNLGTFLMRDRNPVPAIHEFEEVLRLQPEFPHASNALALARKESTAPQASAKKDPGPTPP